ncbi:hypothetical protein [Streptacidiphilus sp. PAMC 29251]
MTSTAKKKAKQLQGFRDSKPGLLLSLGGSAFGGFGIVKEIRDARQEGDTLRLVNAAVAALALATGTAVILRELRDLSDD